MYDDRHKVLLQAFMHNGYLDEYKCKDLMIKLFDHDHVKEVISEINNQLKPLDMNIKSGTCEVTGETYWVFMTNIGKDISSFQTEFSTTELNFMRKILYELTTSTDGFISAITCLNLCTSSDIKMSKSDAAQFLNRMVEAKWLHLKDGQYYIGVRSIIEKLSYFQEMEENIKECILCREPIFYGKTCTQCNSKVHVYCLRKYVMTRGSSQCHVCNNSIELD